MGPMSAGAELCKRRAGAAGCVLGVEWCGACVVSMTGVFEPGHIGSHRLFAIACDCVRLRGIGYRERVCDQLPVVPRFINSVTVARSSGEGSP